MKRLTKHIISLLRHYDSVALPEIGFYSLKYVPASFDKHKITFIPPRFEVRFTYKDSAKGEHLLDSYSRKERIDRVKAHELLQSDISEFKNYLSFGGNPVLPDFDCLNLNFPYSTSQMAFESLGTGWEARSSDDNATSVPQRSIDVFATSAFEAEKSETADCNASLSGSLHRDVNYYYIPIHKKLVKIAACLLLVVAVALSVFIPIPPSAGSKSAASIVPITVVENHHKNEVTSSETDRLDRIAPISDLRLEQKVANSTPEYETTISAKETIEQEAEKPDTYHAVVGAFKTEKEVDSFLAANKDKGDGYTVIKNKNFYLISATASTDKTAFENSLSVIRQQHPDVWVFTAKP